MITLKDICISEFPLHITKRTTDELFKYVTIFELRNDHPLVFNTDMLGVHLGHFLPSDQIKIFEIFEIDYDEFAREIAKCTTIDKKFRVQRHPFNLFAMWAVYSMLNSKDLPARQVSTGVMSMGKLLVYRFFTSLINHNFPYKVNEEIMRFTIDNLNGKYTIKQPETNTWKKLIEKRVELLLLDNRSIHKTTLKHFTPDDKIGYIITDLQSRIRDNVKNITREFMANKDHGDKVSSYGLVDEINGEKLVRNIIDSFTSVTERVTRDILNVNKLLDTELIKLVVKLNTNLREDMFRDILTRFSNMALMQYKKHTSDEIKTTPSGEIFVGYKILIENIIQKTYRRCLLRGLDIKSKIKILEATKNIYSNSRITDDDILKVKLSVDYFVDTHSKTNRDQTKTALKLGFILYIILLSMKTV